MSVEKAIGSSSFFFFFHFDEALEQYSGSPPSSMDHIFSIQERVSIQICTFNLPFCLIDGFHLLCTGNEGKVYVSTERLAGSSEDKSPWNWRDFCGGGNKQPQSALVPGPESGVETPAMCSVPHCSLLSAVGTLPAGQHGRGSCSWWHTGAGLLESFFRKDLDNREEAASRVGRGRQLLLNAEPQTMKGVGEGTISPPLAFPELNR